MELMELTATELVERFHLAGCVWIDPPLRREELEYLTAFTESRRWRRPGGPYAVPDNPLAECLDPALDLALYTTPPAGQPSVYCPWTPARAGHALALRQDVAGGHGVPPHEVAAWLAYLRDHFLRPGALAAQSNEPAFAGFGFDHVLQGAAAVCSEWTGLVTVLQVEANDITVLTFGRHAPTGRA
ncbi:hypothetical protein [Thermasporomyces composti]|jgi:hypothetical protein|uniref:Uncharacterized protein n=1 Tax=Thermasporomyces composti TaxID=696763 RepID=A0A3D9VFI8_THECX|nr:hypothetical protein [Thermasporomyces composti]REF37915.1 hypothetical protein DFJ64_3376 [Thermasporomyces composti]